MLESGLLHMRFLEMSGRSYQSQGIPVIDYKMQEPRGDVNFIETPGHAGSLGLYAGSRTSSEGTTAEALSGTLALEGIKDPAVISHFMSKLAS